LTNKELRHKVYGRKIWLKVRKQALRRDNRQCQHCRLEQGKYTPAKHVHHIIPITKDETKWYDIDNLISLCPPCHKVADGEEFKKMLDERRKKREALKEQKEAKRPYNHLRIKKPPRYPTEDEACEHEHI